MSNENWYVASLVVQVRPEKLAAVKQILTAVKGNEIHAENPSEGKLVVVMESTDEADLVARMEAVKEINGVVAVSLVYSYKDEQ
ncbi:hypothetical protein A4G19_08090 [Pasteurellaceae bacterium Macca]|nr:hypothetical protein [Pasteurellaceae bacterium Macca]